MKTTEYINNPRCLLCKHLGFTLAEVLLTIVLIGTIAITVVPSVMTGWQKQTYKEQTKSVKLNIETALANYITTSGKNNIVDAGLTSLYSVQDFFDQEFRYTKDCGTNPVTKNCFITKYKSGDNEINYPNQNMQCIMLKDSSVICLSEYKVNNGHGIVFMDINGQKGPNTISQDVHMYYFDKKGYISSAVPELDSDETNNLIGILKTPLECSDERKEVCTNLGGTVSSAPYCECSLGKYCTFISKSGIKIEATNCYNVIKVYTCINNNCWEGARQVCSEIGGRLAPSEEYYKILTDLPGGQYWIDSAPSSNSAHYYNSVTKTMDVSDLQYPLYALCVR